MKLLASLLLLPWLLALAPVLQPAPVFEPIECRLFVGKAADVDPVLSRKRLDVLLGDPELGGIARQRNSAELFEVIRKSVLLDFEYRPRSMNRYEDLRARVLARLSRNGGKSVSRFLSRLAVEQVYLEITRLNSKLV
ncbi:MAG: hypothetical protein E6H70_07610 [Betaproteobacteria bacterium]|nr:MAG: hypothetical protein E6H70_07610 [Betaproteobacteria bacterium]